MLFMGGLVGHERQNPQKIGWWWSPNRNRVCLEDEREVRDDTDKAGPPIGRWKRESQRLAKAEEKGVRLRSMAAGPAWLANEERESAHTGFGPTGLSSTRLGLLGWVAGLGGWWGEQR